MKPSSKQRLVASGGYTGHAVQPLKKKATRPVQRPGYQADYGVQSKQPSTATTNLAQTKRRADTNSQEKLLVSNGAYFQRQSSITGPLQPSKQGQQHNLKQVSPRVGVPQKLAPGQVPTKSQKAMMGSSHKKSNSLFNSKIADIISGLQHSLGVINQNIKGPGSQNVSQDDQEKILSKMLMEQTPEQQQLLIESAILADKLAKMTGSLKTNVPIQNQSQQESKKSHQTIAYSGQTEKVEKVNQAMKTIDRPTTTCGKEHSAKSMRKQSMSGYSNGGNFAHPPPKANANKQYLLKSSGGPGYGGSNHPAEERLSITSDRRLPQPASQYMQQNSQGGPTVPARGYHHQRNKSDVNQIKQNEKPLLISQTIDNGQGQGGGIMGPVAHSTKNISQTSTKNAFLQHHQAQINAQQPQTRQKVGPSGQSSVPKEPKITKTFDYDKRSIQKERLSEYNIRKKSGNAASINGPLSHIDPKSVAHPPQMLKSAASSPSLGNAVMEGRKGAIHAEISKKKKSPRQSSTSLSKHKRSASDGSSLSKMFHFKQQMMIQKFQQKGSASSQNQNNSHSNAENSQNSANGIQVKKITNVQMSAGAQVQIMNAKNNQFMPLGQKRASQEQMSTEKLSAFISSRTNGAAITKVNPAQKAGNGTMATKGYSAKHISSKVPKNSAIVNSKASSQQQTAIKQHPQKTQNQNQQPNLQSSQGESQGNKDIYQEMRSFISKFSIQSTQPPQIAAPSHAQQTNYNYLQNQLKHNNHNVNTSMPAVNSSTLSQVQQPGGHTSQIQQPPQQYPNFQGSQYGQQSIKGNNSSDSQQQQQNPLQNNSMTSSSKAGSTLSQILSSAQAYTAFGTRAQQQSNVHQSGAGNVAEEACSLSYNPTGGQRTPNGSYSVAQGSQKKLAQSQNLQKKTQQKNYQPPRQSDGASELVSTAAASRHAVGGHKRSKSDANHMLAQQQAVVPPKQNGFKFSDSASNGNQNQQIQLQDQETQPSKGQKAQPFAFELANYQAIQAQKNNNQQKTAAALSVALQRQQMNSARQSPMNYVDLRNGNGKLFLPSGITETPVINPIDQSKQLYIDVNMDEESCYGNAIANSPILKVLPTPKAQQPGCELNTPSNEVLPFQPQLNLYQCTQPGMHMTYSQYVETPDMSTPLQNLIPQGSFQKAMPVQSKQINLAPKSNKQVDLQIINAPPPAMETNLTTNADMSPRLRFKNRLRKQIKVSFNKYGEPVKTSQEFYRIGKLLGKGAFGKVNLAMHRLCEQLVAIKSINKQYLTEDISNKKKLMQELLILQQIRHQNIVKLFDSFETAKHVAFVMELCGGGDILNYVRKRKKLSEPIAKQILKQVVEGLYYCHKNKIVHRDIKLDNLLLDQDGLVKIGDFGVSKQLQSNEIMNEQCGTPAYIAPEIIRGKGYTGYGVDCWSLGVCLYAMLFGTVPFKANNMQELHSQILKAKYSLKEDKVPLSDDAKLLIKQLLEPDLNKRLNIKQVKNHPWLKEVYDEKFVPQQLFSEVEKEKITKDFSYNDVSRYERNSNQVQIQVETNIDNQNTENLFTEHALDSTQNSLLKNNTTKSVILAPFNSTRSHLDPADLPPEMQDAEESVLYPALSFDKKILYPKKVIKFAPRVKDLDRQYEVNHNSEVDNGVYNKFVKQTSEGSEDNNQQHKLDSSGSFLSQENLLMEGNQAPMGTQNSDEEAEQAVQQMRNKNQKGELQQIQTYVKQQITTTLNTEQDDSFEDEMANLDQEVLNKLEKLGYPSKFVRESLQKKELTDACTVYWLVHGMKLQAQKQLELQKLRKIGGNYRNMLMANMGSTEDASTR